MIDYNYTLQVDEGDEIKEFVPKMPKQLKNILFITGPNSAGKSTLMNIIAAGMYGSTTDSVNQNLRSDIGELIDSDYKKLKFTLNITSPDNSIRIRITKKDYNSDVIVEEAIKNGDFVTLNESQFKSKYNLIYDIPDNPRTRIKEISKIVRKDISNYVDYVTEFSKNITNKVKEVKSVSRKEDIERIKIEISNGENRIAELEKVLPEKKQLAKELSKLLVAKQLVDAINAETESKKKLTEAEKLLPDVYEEDRKAQEQYLKDCKAVNDILPRINSISLGISSTLSDICNQDEMQILYLFRQMTFDDVLDTLKIPDDTLEILNKIESVANRVSKTTSIDDQKKYEMLGKLISITEQYRQYNMGVAGYDTLADFLSNLKTEYKQYEKNNQISTNASRLKKYLSDIKMEIFNLENALKKINKPNDTYDNNADLERQKKLARFRQEYDNAKTKRRNAVNNASSYSVNEKNLGSVLDGFIKSYPDHYRMTASELNQAVNKINEQIATDETAHDRLQSALPRKKQELQELEKMKDHPLKEQLPKLKLLEEQSMKLRKELLDIQKKQTTIEGGSYGSYSKDDVYFQRLWKYLGTRMGTVNHIDAQYEVESVNTIENIITTRTKKIIRINSMGTGQTQMTYLRSLLQKDDGRIVIALFDEVSTMTRQTLDVLFKEFIEMQKNNRLLLGITVQPNDEGKLNVEEMGI